jgi:hypothetical protein
MINSKFIFIIITVIFFLYVSQYTFESFDTINKYDYTNSPTNSVNTGILIDDSYPLIKSPVLGTNGYYDNWKKGDYPIYELGSYEQKTNNIKYPENPDNGECRSADFCFALYDNLIGASNENRVLPPVSSVNYNESRVNYYKTNSNLLPGVPLVQPAVLSL